MEYFPFPDTVDAQKSWAETTDIKSVDHYYHQQRGVAVRRVILCGVLNAFEAIPELEEVRFSFSYANKSIKDSIQGSAGNGDPVQDKKVHAKLDKLMGKYRARVGQDVSTFEQLGLLFSGQPRKLTRANHAHFIKRLVEEPDVRWNDETEAKWAAELLDEATMHAPAKRSGPRL